MADPRNLDVEANRPDSDIEKTTLAGSENGNDVPASIELPGTTKAEAGAPLSLPSLPLSRTLTPQPQRRDIDDDVGPEVVTREGTLDPALARSPPLPATSAGSNAKRACTGR